MSETGVQAKPGWGPEVKLTFAPLQDVKTFLHDETHGGRRGVYMWGFCFPNSDTGRRDPFIPYYVGKAEADIQCRLFEHLNGIRYGTHRILRWQCLLEKACCAKYFHRATPPSEYCNYAYLNKRAKMPKADLPEPQRAALEADIRAYVDSMFVTCLAVNGLGIGDEAQFVKALESHVQDKFGGEHGTEWLISQRGKGHSAHVSPTIRPGLGTEHLFPRP
jgi:hypothetical protein